MQDLILAIDDMPEILMSIASILDEYDVRIAKTAKAAFSILANEQVSLILLDIEMPQMSGFEFIKKLYDQSEYRHIPVLFVTANSDEETIARILQTGVKGYIVKPFTTDTVKEKVSAVLDAASHIYGKK
jgi:putative two-component system response regulator